MLVERFLSTRFNVGPLVACAAEAVQISDSKSSYVAVLSRGRFFACVWPLTGSSSSSPSSSDDERQSTLEVLRSDVCRVLLLLFFEIGRLSDAARPRRSPDHAPGDDETRFERWLGRGLGLRYISLLQPPAELWEGFLPIVRSVDFDWHFCSSSYLSRAISNSLVLTVLSSELSGQPWFSFSDDSEASCSLGRRTFR